MLLTNIIFGVGVLGALAMLHRWLFWDLGAQRRGRRAACVILAEIARQYPEAAPLALSGLRVASLPGDPPPAKELNGPG